jgi:osmoprotectant transport system ATP-binding protein
VVGVREGAQFVGVLTPGGIHRALRASLAGEQPGPRNQGTA